MSLLKRDEFLSASSCRHKDVPVPEISADAEVRIKAMSTNELEEWEALMMFRRGEDGKIQKVEGMRAELVTLCAVDEDGVRLFSSEDIAALGEFNGIVVDRLADVAMDINGLSDKKLEEMRKNSDADPSSELG